MYIYSTSQLTGISTPPSNQWLLGGANLSLYIGIYTANSAYSKVELDPSPVQVSRLRPLITKQLH